MVRILVDQSGYDLLNIGDVAMLQGCVTRLRQQWPDSDIMVVAHAPGRLESYCPGTTAIGRTYADLPVFRLLPRRTRLGSEQIWKMTAPYFSGHLGNGRRPRNPPRTAVEAVRGADIVVASGGGYVTDTWWWHAAGVLSLLALAQRLGKPTAMFGQGIGPLRHRPLRAQARTVLPRLSILGLREERIGRDEALSLGAPPAIIRTTGDDALELTGPGPVQEGTALGVNMRVNSYAGVDPAVAASVGNVLLTSAAELRAPMVALPVSRYAADGDLGAIRDLLGVPGQRPGVVLDDLPTPQALAGAVARCRAVVTGSYHAAVLALAHGVPAVCLTRSSYYDAKFAGLQALFPSACSVVPLGEPDLPGRLRRAVGEAWHLPASARAAAREAGNRQRDCGREAYRQFRSAVESGAPPVLVGGGTVS